MSCTGADFRFADFSAGSNTVAYRVTVDGAVAAQDSFTLNANGGREGDLYVPLVLHDSHTVEAFAWWGPTNVQDGHTRAANSPALASRVLTCATAPPPATAPTPTAPAPSAAAPPPAPSSAVRGTRSSSARARLAVPRACRSRAARVTVTGRLMRRVSFLVNGRRVRTMSIRAGQRSLSASLPLRRSGPARQTVTARVTFRGGAPARTMIARATRCAQTEVSPQFTG